MKARLATTLAATLLLCASASAQTVIIDEQFESYADTAAMEAVWTPDLGQGNQPTAGPKGILVPDTAAGLTPPYDDPPGIQGKGVNMLANINEYNGPATSMLTNLVPTNAQAIRLSADIFDNNQTHRVAVSIRNDTVPRGFGVVGSNFIEMGFYNTRDPNTHPALPADPPPPTTLNFTGFAYRLNTLFNTTSLVNSGLARQPNWQNFDLDPILDRPDEEEGDAPNNFTTQADIGPGWHRFTVEIGTKYHKFTLDLFRDGLHNTDNVEGVGYAGVDSEVVWFVSPNNDATEPNPFDPFTSLRFGSPSGIANPVEAVVDNILLQTVTPTVGVGADFDADNDVDGGDFLIWQRQLGTFGQLGDVGRNGFVDGADLTNSNVNNVNDWTSQFGGAPIPFTPPPPAGAVPEPASAALVAVALFGAVAARRRAH
jgi:hypothetical protein